MWTGRGHWPAGRRRGSNQGRAQALARIAHAVEGRRFSIREIARMLSVSDRSVRRWLAEEDWPSRSHIEAIGLVLGGRAR
ncbi:MAG: helix-turn-helix domain-containing protein [Gammaproteobacteria bacterium]